MSYVDIKTNIPELVTFKFSSWKRWENDGKDGKYIKYSIGVENRGEDKYLSIYEREYQKYFESLGDLKDRILEILKYEDGKYKSWKIIENGVDITPGGTNTPVHTQNVTQRNFEANNDVPDVQETIAKMRVAFQSMADAHKALEMRVSGLETIVADLTSKDAVDLHQSFNIEARNL